MKIADFFIALGFQVKGKEDVDKADQSVQKLEFSSLKLLAGVTGLNAAFYAMITKAVEGGVALQRFALTTGLSTDELQRWQLTAVRGNVAAGEMASALGAIQKARAAIAFGNPEGAAPWMLLGIDPRQDPIKVLEQLRAQIIKFDPAIAKNVLSQLGMSEDMYYLMKQPNFGRGAANKSITVNPEEIARLSALGGAWKEFLLTFERVLTKFSASAFAQTLTDIVKGLTATVSLLGGVANWMEKDSYWAQVVKIVLLEIVGVMGLLGVAAAVLMFGPFGLFAATLGIMAIALAGLVLLIQDFWVACRGGKSAFDWNDGLLLTVQNVERLAHAMQTVMEIWDQFVAKTNKGEGMWGLFKQMQNNSWSGDGHSMFEWHRPAWMGGGGDTNQTNHINVTVPPASNAHETGRDVGRGIGRQVSDAFQQMPLPSR